MIRFIIASRFRPDIDSPKYLGMYKFSVVPSALFTPDRFLHQTNEKSSSTAIEIWKLTEESHEILPPDEESGARKAMIFDVMTVVNRINIKKSKMKMFGEFAEAFVNMIWREATGYDDIRVVFDRYIERSLKANTRSKCTHGMSVHYKVSHQTPIRHLTTKHFLSSIETKNELT